MIARQAASERTMGVRVPRSDCFVPGTVVQPEGLQRVRASSAPP